MKKLLVILTVLVSLVFGQSILLAQDTTAAPKEMKKTEMKSEKKTQTKGVKKSHKGKKHHKKNMEMKEVTPNN
jgi:Sec-independent protein translocase protein TatA